MTYLLSTFFDKTKSSFMKIENGTWYEDFFKSSDSFEGILHIWMDDMREPDFDFNNYYLSLEEREEIMRLWFLYKDLR
jgi:hypothetical protein